MTKIIYHIWTSIEAVLVISSTECSNFTEDSLKVIFLLIDLNIHISCEIPQCVS